MVELDDEQRMLLDALSDLVAAEFAEDAFSWEGEFPWENVRLLADRGFLGINFDPAYGGGGMSELDAMRMLDAIGRVCPDTAFLAYTLQYVAPRAIEMFGSEAAKERYLPSVVDGESYIAIGISEPEAGSDVQSMNTTIREEDGELLLSGEKTWVSGVPEADACVVWAKYPEGLGTAIMDFDAPGVEIGNHFTNMMGHTQTQFYMEDVVIPAENVLVRGREAFKDQLRALNWERLGSATLANAVARCALEHALEYAGQREQFGQPIAEFQGIEWKLADMATSLEASRALTYRAADRAVTGGRPPSRLDSSIAKLYSGEMVERVVSESLQIHGANGYQQGHPLEYLYRMARSRRIAAGTDEIQKNQIAAALKREGVPSIA